MTFFDLFAGIGGFRLGFEREGYTCVGFCESDKYARSLYKKVFKTEETGEFEWDNILTINPDNVPDFKVLTAGFPCQPFSTIGKRRELKDEKAYPLWDKMFRFIEKKRPSILVFENVKGLLSANRGWAFAYFLHRVDEIGYDAEWTILNSKNFGVPQSRERVFIICYFRKRCSGKIFPLTESDKVYYRSVETKKGIHENFEQKEIAGTLTTKQGINWSGNFVYDDSFSGKIGIRRLTPLECFRLQGFPDSIYHKVRELKFSDSQFYKMTGNAATVQVVQTIAKKLKKLIFTNTEEAIYK